MPTLPKDLRSKLEKAVIAARDEATEGAKAASIALGVGDGKKPGHLDAAGEKLRRRLRARGRQAGDLRRPDDSQETRHLAEECAYEHWHRMLFARFLAENDLLRHPEMGVSVSLEECEELAREEGLDLWELAARFAQHMLPQVFRQDDPVLQLRLPGESRSRLTTLLNDLPPAVFTADDSLGWTYQFWQTKRKKEVNESGVKIGADELSPVTQLFTEDYMVEFLLHNTLGAWSAGKLGPITAASEEEARAQAALPARDGLGVHWTYLRFVQDEVTKTWKPAAGAFEGWPRKAKDITFLDPCMGSGHFPVFALPILARLRMEEENFSAAEAVTAVLRDNIHGLELDPRCCQIGAFNLALTAWKLGGYQPLPPLHIACCGLAPQAKLDDWLSLAGDTDKLRRGMERLYRLFEKAPVLGSLINPRIGGGDLLEAGFEELQPLLSQALAHEAGDEAHELAVVAQGVTKAAEILAGQFTPVATNVPYLGRGKQDEVLQDYCERIHPDAKSDLATSLIERCLKFCAAGSSSAVVAPQNWLFLGTYKSFRQRLLRTTQWESVVRLGEGGFESSQAAGAFTALTTHTLLSPREKQAFLASDASKNGTPEAKAILLRDGKITHVDQQGQLKNPDAALAFELVDSTKLLGRFAECFQGISSGDSPRLVLSFWEVENTGGRWSLFQCPPASTSLFAGREFIVDWRTLDAGFESAAIRGHEAWGKRGVAIGQMRALPATLYIGTHFSNSTPVIVPNRPDLLPAIWAFCSSPIFNEALRKLNPKVSVDNGYVGKVPFDIEHWQVIASKSYPNGLPKPHSNDPTQWLFNGHPAGADQPLHVAVARLLGYRWPRQTGSSFPDCPTLEPDGLESFADADGIVCLTSLRGEANATDRLRTLLHAALGTFDEHALIASAGSKSSKSKDLEDWLRDEFFEQHCDLFHQRPFVWHLWDGRKDGFHAIVNYHRLAGPDGAGRRTLEALTHGYLRDWITRQRDSVTRGEPGAEDRLAAALELHEKLEAILAGEPPYDLFIRWKPLHRQPIGWEPDLNDGVRLNARPFLATDLSRGKRGAGLFRAKINLNWRKDRGTEPNRPKEDFPWFWTWDERTEDFPGGAQFDGNRWNDLHYTTAAKQAARERQFSKEL
jgi:hypothetical protein